MINLESHGGLSNANRDLVNMYIAIVDAYSSGATLAIELHKRNCNLIHIKSSQHIDPIFLNTFPEGIFSIIYKNENHSSKLCSELSKHPISYVIAGTESGIQLAEKIANKLQLPTNHPDLIDIRIDKFKAISKLKEKGFNTRRQFLTRSANDLKQWEGFNFKLPLIVKPTQSAGSDGVTICKKPSEVNSSVLSLLHQKNKLGLFNNEVLIEEYLEGQEFIVDMMHFKNQVELNHICLSVKNNISGNPIYDHIRTVSFSEPIVQKITSYLIPVLNTLGYQHGPSHSEVIVTQKGPQLIEASPRLSGANLPQILNSSSSNSSLDCWIEILASKSSSKIKIEAPSTKQHT